MGPLSQFMNVMTAQCTSWANTREESAKKTDSLYWLSGDRKTKLLKINAWENGGGEYTIKHSKPINATHFGRQLCHI